MEKVLPNAPFLFYYTFLNKHKLHATNIIKIMKKLLSNKFRMLPCRTKISGIVGTLKLTPLGNPGLHMISLHGSCFSLNSQKLAFVLLTHSTETASIYYCHATRSFTTIGPSKIIQNVHICVSFR